LIVRIVAHGNPAAAHHLSHPPQEGIASPPGRFLHGKAVLLCYRQHLDPLDGAGKAPVSCHLADKIGIGVGFIATQAVVKMGDVE
jgi:hypothetical protein